MALKVIGAGLGRTGTLSLKLALEQLGFGPCYHMTEVLMEPSRGAGWLRAAGGQPDWNAIFSEFASTVDYPGCVFWRELSQFYPSAKVLLSVRDPRDWFDSTQQTIFSDEHNKPLIKSALSEFFEKTVFEAFRDRIHDGDFMIAARSHAGMAAVVQISRRSRAGFTFSARQFTRRANTAARIHGPGPGRPGSNPRGDRQGVEGETRKPATQGVATDFQQTPPPSRTRISTASKKAALRLGEDLRNTDYGRLTMQHLVFGLVCFGVGAPAPSLSLWEIFAYRV